MGYIDVRHSSRCSSSRYRLHGEFAIYQESTEEIIETVVSCDSEADHWPNWKYWNYTDWLAAALLERETTLLTGRAVQFAATAKTDVFSDTVLCLGGISTEPVKAWESIAYGNTLFERIGSDRRRTDGIRGETIPRIHNIGSSRRDSEDITELKCEPEPQTLNGKNEEQRKLYWERSQNYARRFTRGLWSFLALGSDKNATELMSANLMDNGTKLLKTCAQLCRERTSYIPCYQRIRKRRVEKQMERYEIHSLSTVAMKAVN